MKFLSTMQRLGTKLAAGASIIVMTVALPLAVHAETGSAFVALNKNFTDTSAAAGVDTAKGEGALPKLIGGFIKQAIGLLGIILVVLIIYAGFLWMTAAGNEDKVKKAKAILTNAVVGMVLIFAAYAVTDFVIGALIKGTSGTAS